MFVPDYGVGKGREDKAFYIIDGEFEPTVAGQPLRAGAGQSVFGRRSVHHNFKNVGSTPGRMLVTATPAGLARDSEPSLRNV